MMLVGHSTLRPYDSLDAFSVIHEDTLCQPPVDQPQSINIAFYCAWISGKLSLAEVSYLEMTYDSDYDFPQEQNHTH
jgi:hypothetical protein